MKKLDTLKAINRLSQKDTKWIHKNIFRILRKEEIWIAAYEKLKGNKDALTSGSSPETINDISLKRLRRLKEKVCCEAYKFNPVKLTYIPRLDGRKRPVGLPSANDKIVQEAMRMILEAIYEPIFSEISFGFRTGLGCHDALAHVEKKFRWVDFVIEGSIEQAYPTIDHHILVRFLKKRIDDPRFIRLIWKLLGCGALSEKRILWSKTGVPQGSIVSPILANIYYHELDEFILTQKEKHENSSIKLLKSQAYKALEYKINKVSKEIKVYEPQSLERQKLAKELKLLRMKRLKTEGLKDNVIRIEYVRYADDWMIGVSRNRNLALKLKIKVSDFLRNELAQQLHPIKTKVSDLRVGNVHFLGYKIFLPRNRLISTYKGKGVRTIRIEQPQLRFDIPVAKVTQRYAERGYFKRLSNRIRPISRASYSVLEDHVIVSHYRSLWLGFSNYYSGCTKRGRLQYIHYLLHMSCAMTLGHRHRMSCAKIFKKHGKNLTVKIPNTDKIVSFPYKTNWKLSERKWFHGKQVSLQGSRYGNLISYSSLGLPCVVCDSKEGPIEMHYVKHVRKQVPLCKNCHQKVHAGLYDGLSLSSLRKSIRKEYGS